MPSRRVLPPTSVYGESAPQGGSRLPIISLIRLEGTLRSTEPSTTRSSAFPVAGTERGCRRVEYCCSPACNGERAPRGVAIADHFAHSASRARSDRLSRAPPAPAHSPSLGPSADAVASSIAAHQRVTVRARPKVGRDCRSFRSFASRARSDRLSQAPAAPAHSPSLGPNADAVASSIAAQQRVAVRARPKVGRDCRSFRSFAWRARSDRPSRAPAAPAQSPSPGTECRGRRAEYCCPVRRDAERDWVAQGRLPLPGSHVGSTGNAADAAFRPLGLQPIDDPIDRLGPS
jgi:hypothetical protein